MTENIREQQQAIPPSPNDEIAALKAAVQKLEAEASGLPGWVRKWGAILVSIVSLCFSVGFQVADRVFAKPDIRIYKGEESPLSMMYDPAADTLQFAFSLGIGNFGKRNQMITGLEATLMKDMKDFVSSPQPLRFAGPDFHCFVQGVEVGLPFPVGTNLPATMNCTIVAGLSKPTRGVIDDQGVKHLNITFTEDGGKPHAVEFCFFLSRETTAYAESHVSGVRFLNPGPPCDQ